MKYKALSAQGTEIRVHAGVVDITTFVKAGAYVTVTLNGHGMESATASRSRKSSKATPP